MKSSMKLLGILFVLVILGCSSSTSDSIAENENVSEEDNEQREEPSQDKETTAIAEQTTTNDEYPMPILSGWEEIETVFETIGNGTIDVWHGEFSFDGEIDDYFEPYQVALTDMGFVVTVTQDDEGMKSLEFTKEINGDNHAGNVLFNDNWVKSSLQHFK